jgi:hypothetical protein
MTCAKWVLAHSTISETGAGRWAPTAAELLLKPIIDASNWASTPCDPNFYRSVDL